MQHSKLLYLNFKVSLWPFICPSVHPSVHFSETA